MFGKFPIEINRASKIVTGAFLLMVMATALISEFFQAPKDITTDINHFRLLFSQESFTDISKFSIRNRIGKFSFIRIGNSTRLNLTEPHPISANVETINKIFNVLRQINVRGTHSNDAINISNYALSNPSMEIELTHSNGRTYKLSFGLVNPIDNSTYLLDSSQQIIYQIDNALSSLERTSLADVVN